MKQLTNTEMFLKTKELLDHGMTWKEVEAEFKDFLNSRGKRINIGMLTSIWHRVSSGKLLLPVEKNQDFTVTNFKNWEKEKREAPEWESLTRGILALNITSKLKRDIITVIINSESK